MDPKRKKILIIVGISAFVVIAGITGISIYYSNKKKNDQVNIDALLLIAKNEGEMNEADYQKYRKLVYIDMYKLPASLQNAFNRMKPILEKAGTAARAGYWNEYLRQINLLKAQAPTDPTQRNFFNKVYALIEECFTTGSSDENTQRNLNGAKEKSTAWWRYVLEVVAPVPTIAITGKSELWGAFKQITSAPMNPAAKTFNNKLISQDFDTLKLFDEAYKALMGGKGYFDIQKHPKV